MTTTEGTNKTTFSTSEQVNILDHFTLSNKTNNQDFEDNYILESEEISYEGDFRIEERVYLDVKNNVTIRKMSRIKLFTVKSKYEAEQVKKRMQWKKYGDAITDKPLEDNADDVWFDWNPEIFKSRKTRNWMNQYNQDYQNNKEKEQICFQKKLLDKDDIPKCLNKYIELQTNRKEIEDMKVANEAILNRLKLGDTEAINNNSSLFAVNKSAKTTSDSKTNGNTKGNTNGNTSGYTPPHLKRQNSNLSDTKNNETKKYENVIHSNTKYSKFRSKVNKQEIDKQTVKISNLPSDITFDTLIYHFKQKLGRLRFKLKTIKNHRTGALKDFCFLNFDSEHLGEEAFNLLQGIKIDHSVLQIEWGRKRD
jgi:hypothetical protein